MKLTFAELHYLVGADARSASFRNVVGLGEHSIDVSASGLASLLMRDLATLSGDGTELSPELEVHASALSSATTWLGILSLAPGTVVAGAIGLGGSANHRVIVSADDPGVFDIQFLRDDTTATSQLVDLAVSLSGPLGGVLVTNVESQEVAGIAHNEDGSWSGQTGSTIEPLSTADEDGARSFLAGALQAWDLPA